MTHHETVACITCKIKIETNIQTPHLWPDHSLMLSHEAKALLGERISWLINALEISAQLGPDGYAAFDCGTFRWGKNSVSWELRTYDQDCLYRVFDNQVDHDKIRVIFVLTAPEALENLAQEQVRLAALGALYCPTKIRPEKRSKRPFRSKRRSASQSHATAQG